jgi:hypothetical protein
MSSIQKYSLQRRDAKGSFKKVVTLSQPITPEEVLEKYGSGYFVLRATKPRFKTIWKKQLGDESDRRFQSLEKRAKYLTYGLVGVAATETIGFGLSTWKFITTNERLDKIEAVLQLLKPGLTCSICSKPLDYYLQRYCSQCGALTNWPKKFFQAANTVACFHCKFPLQSHQVFCPHCGQRRPIQLALGLSDENSTRFEKVVF